MRKQSASVTDRQNDQRAYFQWQYETTRRFHERYWQTLDWRGGTVLDVGSGLGGRAPYLIETGAARVVCIDVNVAELATGRRILDELYPNAAPDVDFIHPNELRERDFGNVALLVDCFEHLLEPETVLNQVHGWLKPGGRAWIGSIGWYHHGASHCGGEIPIPWSQVLFSEKAIIRTIQRVYRDPDFQPSVWDKLEGMDRWDDVTTLRDRPGEPLNMLSLRRIRTILRKCGLQLEEFKVHSFSGRKCRLSRFARGLAKIPIAQELFHSYYTAILKKPPMQAA